MNTNQSQGMSEDKNLRDQVIFYLRNWGWFVFGVIVAMSVAFLYIRYSTPYYQTISSIVIKDSKDSGGATELAALEEVGLITGMNSNSIENELEILKSRRLLLKVIEKLQLHKFYFIEGNLRSSEIFGDRPFEFNILQEDESSFYEKSFMIYDMSLSSYKIKDLTKDKVYESNFGERLELDYGTVILLPTPALHRIISENKIESVKVSVFNIDEVLFYFRSNIKIIQAVKNSSVILFSLKYPLKDKAESILNELVNQYNIDATEDKNIISQNTAKFIEERLQVITKELDSVENSKVKFKQVNQLVDLESESQLTLMNTSETNQKIVELSTQSALVDFITERLQNEDEISLLPSNLGITEDGVQGLIHSYNLLVLERNKLLKSSTEENPMVVALTSQIKQLRINVITSLGNAKNSVETAIADLKRQEDNFKSQINRIPQTEKDFRSIVRQQEIKESLYIFLLQKREETALSLAVTAPKAKIVDSAYSSTAPVSPKKSIVLLTAFTVGLGLPFLVLYIGLALNNKIRERKDIERITSSIPIVGEVPKLAHDDAKLIKQNDTSVLAESFRIIRTNIQYMLSAKNISSKGKRIFVTSTVKGEGKTFVSVNMAITFANIGKNVLLMGCDLRNPRMHEYLPISRKTAGLTDFLVSSEELTDISSYIVPSGLNTNLSLLTSGSIPPNPAEILMNNKVSALFEYLSSIYDVIIVDTAPSLLVTDTFIIQGFSDITVYIAKADYTEKNLIEFPVDCVKDMRFKDNIAFLLNNVSIANFGYGNKYGYTYGKKKTGFTSRIKERYRRFLPWK